MPRVCKDSVRGLSARLFGKIHFSSANRQRMRTEGGSYHVQFTQVQPLSSSEPSFDYIGKLLLQLDDMMRLQMRVMKLADDIAEHSRWQLLCIFFQLAVGGVFNSYHLVTYLLNYAITGQPGVLPLGLSLLYYGTYIVAAMFMLIKTVVAFSMVYKSLQRTQHLICKCSLYASDERLRVRLAQYAACINYNLHKYTIMNLYTLDGSLVMSMISGSATYIVILLQYGNETELCVASIAADNQTVNN